MAITLNKIPVTILTGFLGSGKTTLINHLLSKKGKHRIAIIENEVGEVDVDSDLVLASEEEVFQIVNDCLCCVIPVRNDLARILHLLLRRRNDFDAILLECSGLSDPTPVSAVFFKDPVLAEQLSLDAIVTLVDALHVERHLDDPALVGVDNQVVDQIASADRILLNKTDLADGAVLDRIEKRLKGINAGAEIIRVRNAQVEPDRILGVHGFAPATLSGHEEIFLGDPELAGEEHHDHEQHQDHAHDASLGSVSLLFQQPFALAALREWLAGLLEASGDDIFRLKGIVAIEGDPRKYVLQCVHRILELRPGENWAEKPPSSKFVFIGRGLQRQVLQAGLEPCLAPPTGAVSRTHPAPRRTA